MTASREKIVVAMSGGVDSSVAAALLQEQGHDVVGVFMRNGVKAAPGRGHRQGCCGVEDALDARRVADRLGIPFYAVDFEDAFDGLIREFVDAYRSGRTPNPCIECNRRFKLGRLLALATDLGARAVATGHYARVAFRGGRWAVERARDEAKDQSYVLFSLGQDALARTLFPVGDLTKSEVRAEARRFGLTVSGKPESMEICFVPTGDYRDVLRERAPDVLAPGPILDRNGSEVGRHEGTAFYTIGQRRGLVSGRRDPVYVTAIDPRAGTVTIGGRDDLLVAEFEVEEVVWSGSGPPAPDAELRCEVMIRSHHRAAPATARALDRGRLRIRFDAPEPAVTPGQAAVLFSGSRILAGGWIAAAADRGAAGIR